MGWNCLPTLGSLSLARFREFIRTHNSSIDTMMEEEEKNDGEGKRVSGRSPTFVFLSYTYIPKSVDLSVCVCVAKPLLLLSLA